MKTLSTILMAGMLAHASFAAATTPQLIEYKITGPKDKRVNVVYFGEGYTAAQKGKFLFDVERFQAEFMDAPLSNYRNYFNHYAVFAESAQSGASLEDGRTRKNTYFGCSYWTASIARLLACNNNTITRIKNHLIPEADIVLVIVNTYTYGGSGGQYAVASSNHPEIVVHEVGHSFALLADEYESPYPGWRYHEYPNATAITNRNNLIWKHWVNTDVPVPTPKVPTYANTVGLFEGAQYTSIGWYRPTQNSRMRTNGKPLGPVNAEQFVLAMYDHVSPLESSRPAAGSNVTWRGPGTLSVEPMRPTGSQLAIEWRVNGSKVAEGGRIFNGTGLVKGHTATVEARVSDRTHWVKKDSNELTVGKVSWTVTVPK